MFKRTVVHLRILRPTCSNGPRSVWAFCGQRIQTDRGPAPLRGGAGAILQERIVQKRLPDALSHPCSCKSCSKKIHRNMNGKLTFTVFPYGKSLHKNKHQKAATGSNRQARAAKGSHRLQKAATGSKRQPLRPSEGHLRAI